MIIQSISFSSSVQVNDGHWRKLSFEAELDPTDDPETAAEILKNRVENLLEKFGKPLVHDINEVLPQSTPKETWRRQMISQIQACIAIDEKNKYDRQIGLLAYKEATDSDEEIAEAYNKKLKELSTK